MRAIGKSAAVGAVAATLVGVCLSAAGPAMADPLKTPTLTTLAGVGSDTVTPLFDNGTKAQPKGDAPGTFVHDYNATKPTFPVASWDAVDPSTGVAGANITTKAASSSDASCSMPRPDGSSAGIAALDANQKDSHSVSGQSSIYCLDYARSSRPPTTTTDNNNAFVEFAKDAIAWSYPKVSGKTNPQPKAMNLTDLENIYTCKWTNWDQIPGNSKHKAPIGVVIPQNGSGTRATWLLQLGIPSTTVEPCWQNGTVTVSGKTDVIEENTGLSAGNKAQFTKTQDFGTTCAKGCAPTDDIFPYSIGDWIAQTKAAKGVGGHATSVWGHGNMNLAESDSGTTAEEPTAKNSSGQLVINPKFPAHFYRTLYAVTRNSCFNSSKPTGTAVCLPTTTPPAGGVAYPAYEATGLKAFFGPSGWICKNATAAKDIASYGFTKDSSCGKLTAGD